MKSDNVLKNLVKKSWWMFLIVLFAGLIIFIPLPQSQNDEVDRHFQVEASMFQFTPGRIRVNQGDRITLELISTDVVHGLSIDGYDFELMADPGQSQTATFIANKTGVFRFRCSIACGNMHPFMIGKLQVGPNWELIRGIVLGGLAVFAAILSFRKSSLIQKSAVS